MNSNELAATDVLERYIKDSGFTKGEVASLLGKGSSWLSDYLIKRTRETFRKLFFEDETSFKKLVDALDITDHDIEHVFLNLPAKRSIDKPHEVYNLSAPYPYTDTARAKNLSDVPPLQLLSGETSNVTQIYIDLDNVHTMLVQGDFVLMIDEYMPLLYGLSYFVLIDNRLKIGRYQIENDEGYIFDVFEDKKPYVILRKNIIGKVLTLNNI